MQPPLVIERASPSRGTIVLVHGLGEHSGRYAHVVSALHDDGWTVVTYDQRGHGIDDGARGALPSADSPYEDLAFVIDTAVRETTPARLLLFGHSMGGAFAARYVAEALESRPASWSRPVDGLILTSPALAIFMKPIDRVALKVLHWLAPHLPRRNGLDATRISHDPEVVAAYRADPLVHDRVTPRLVQVILDAGRIVLERAPRWRVPTLLLYAGDDHLVDARGSASFAAAAPRTVVEAQAFPALYHEILNETQPERGEVFTRIHEWLSFFAAR
ncbi:MAG: lysophospholipase [Acidobacteriota bacterium]